MSRKWMLWLTTVTIVLSMGILFSHPRVSNAQANESSTNQIMTYGYEEHRKALLELGLPADIVEVSMQLQMEYHEAVSAGATREELNTIVEKYQSEFDAISATSTHGVHALTGTASSTKNLYVCCVNGGKSTFGYSGGSSWISDIYWSYPSNSPGNNIKSGTCAGVCTGLDHTLPNPVSAAAMNYNVTYVRGSAPYFLYHNFGCY